MFTCSNCGQTYDAKVNFCTNCGCRFLPQNPPVTRQRPSGNGGDIVFSIVGFALSLFSCVFWAICQISMANAVSYTMEDYSFAILLYFFLLIFSLAAMPVSIIGLVLNIHHIRSGVVTRKAQYGKYLGIVASVLSCTITILIIFSIGNLP